MMEKRMSLSSRRELLYSTAERYRWATKKEKGLTLCSVGPGGPQPHIREKKMPSAGLSALPPLAVGRTKHQISNPKTTFLKVKGHPG